MITIKNNNNNINNIYSIYNYTYIQFCKSMRHACEFISRVMFMTFIFVDRRRDSRVYNVKVGHFRRVQIAEQQFIHIAAVAHRQVGVTYRRVVVVRRW